jgi:hypothetical protein
VAKLNKNKNFILLITKEMNPEANGGELQGPE